MESPVDVHALPPKPTPPTGFTLKGHKRLKLSSDDTPPHLAHDEKFEQMTPKKPSNIEDYSNPFVASEFLHHLDNGTLFGSVTKDIMALAHKKMQLVSSYSAKHPTLVDYLSKVAVMKHGEEIHKSENQQVTGSAYQNVIDLECELVAKHVPQKPLPAVVIIDSDEEDDIYQNSFLPINEVELPKPLSPVAETTISLEGEHLEKQVSPTPFSVVTVDSDEEDDTYQKSFPPSNEVALPKKSPPAVKMTAPRPKHKAPGAMHQEPSAMPQVPSTRHGHPPGTRQHEPHTRHHEEYQAPIACCEESDDLNFESNLTCKGNTGRDKTIYVGVPKEPDDHVDTEDEEPPIACCGEGEDMNFETSLSGKGSTERDKVVYVGVPKEQDDQVDTEDEELDDIWTEMSMGIECSKDVSVNPMLDEESKKDEDCDHSFVLKYDLGYVCRVCGLIDRGIETIFEFQYQRKRTSRTYLSESCSASASEKISTQILQGGFKNSTEELMPKISVHPRHMKQMKPHQVEGFNFLCSNLISDNPGGCILAHAPGSGKTFLIISFMQSFLAMSPNARPLVVLPKGILATWKKEFQTWQVEDIPLYDFYTVKADNRAKQLSVLRKWVEHRSVLFLGYQQFSTIICDDGTEAKECQKILLKVPTILVLDEGHTPRNEETDVVQSLARVQTPLKVVLSGTLYQNHVKEVFNILKLVRPKFMKSQTSRDIQRRIMSRVQISRMRNPSKDGSDLAFFELVEKTLQQKDDLKRKAAVIQDLREMTSKVLHYYKGDFLDELPGLVDYTLLLNLSSSQKSEVEKLKHLDHFKRTAVGSLLYVHPQLKSFSEKFSSDGEKGSSCINDKKMDAMVKEMTVKIGAKTKFFLTILKLCQSAGEKLLVFSQYILPLKLFERLSIKLNGWRRDKELFMLTGDSSYEQREWSMERFNHSPDAKVFFGSIKACGEGISLVGASRIIILDVHLNPSVTRQAIGRAFRPGQMKKVYTYRLVAADSPEEEDHNTCFRKELIAKMWFEWNENCGNQQFEMKAIDVDECDDPFLESLSLREDIKTLYKR